MIFFIKKNVDKKRIVSFLRYGIIVFFLLLFFLLTLILNFFFFTTKEKVIFRVKTGDSIQHLSNLLKEKGLVSSKNLTQLYIQYKNISPKSGVYVFSRGLSSVGIIENILYARYGDVYKKITFPEGSTNKQIFSIIKKYNSSFNDSLLFSLMREKEGYLFPDTYSFLPSVSEKKLIETIGKTFQEKKEKAFSEKKVDHTDKDLIIMASLVEKEAGKNLEEKQIISGVLWKRIKKGMLLQVDAPFLYERGKGSAQLSRKDLVKDSLYNTYTNKGLPPTPIGNPGYDALYAAAHPIESDYLFYLHDKQGKIHYGKNYREHLRNIKKYLK